MVSAASSGWSNVVLLVSIFGPVTIAVILVIVVTRWWRSDPDAARLKQEQAEYERQQRRSQPH